VKAIVMQKPGQVVVDEVPDLSGQNKDVLLKVRMVGLCGSDLNSFRGRNPMVAYPCILGHEVAATVVEDRADHPAFVVGANVTLSPYTECGKCPSCLRGRPNACQFNETMGVQRDGALREYISVSARNAWSNRSQ
jgi:threonine dehydrogenase-like Zn-dependent dehydrogenase